MRIIGGELKGKRLISVPGVRTRPTADRLRESIFNIISGYLQDSIVLDLFAGTGALGLESLSRGARFAVFIDKCKIVLSVIERNIQSCELEKKTKVIKWNAFRNLNCLKGFQPAFNLVFMDPPYGRHMVAPTLKNLHRRGCLEKGTLIVVEHLPCEVIDEKQSMFTLSDRRKYGKTLVSFLKYMV